MGFFSNLFGKKSDKLTQKQLDEIEVDVEKTQERHKKDRAIFSDLKKPISVKIKNPVKKIVKKQSGKKVKERTKRKSKK